MFGPQMKVKSHTEDVLQGDLNTARGIIRYRVSLEETANRAYMTKIG